MPRDDPDGRSERGRGSHEVVGSLLGGDEVDRSLVPIEGAHLLERDRPPHLAPTSGRDRGVPWQLGFHHEIGMQKSGQVLPAGGQRDVP